MYPIFCQVIIPTIFGQYISNILLELLGATTVSVGIIGEPVLAILLAYLFIGEGILVTQFIVGMMTLIGVGIYFWSNNKSEKKENERWQPLRIS
ncbi:DMT family transporter [Paenibacillus brevis]|uniref:DMT family transporter n=1 Tax=Paenibacillus brevis TaxID=2841508 RepID=UPI00201A909F|nr:DMT family transporter [Paenibacillus brevis]